MVVVGASALLALSSRNAWAHGFGGSGLLHPLTGFDHMLAMLAVGAWSAARGGRAMVVVPAVFVVAMAVGGAFGLACGEARWVEGTMASSVLGLGLAMALRLRASSALPSTLALLATVVFGFAHGYGHGAEMPSGTSPATYVTGFLITTAALHGAGAAIALLVLERRDGDALLRAAGALLVGAGLWLVCR